MKFLVPLIFLLVTLLVFPVSNPLDEYGFEYRVQERSIAKRISEKDKKRWSHHKEDYLADYTLKDSRGVEWTLTNFRYYTYSPTFYRICRYTKKTNTRLECDWYDKEDKRNLGI